MVFFERADQIRHRQIFQLPMPFEDGNALRLKRRAALDARRKIEFQGVDRPLNHGLIRLWKVAAKKLHRLLFPPERNHRSRPDRLEGLLAIVFVGDARELEATLKQRLLVLTHGLGIVCGVQIHELVHQLPSAGLRHALQEGFNFRFQTLPFLRQLTCEVARHQHIVLKPIEELKGARCKGVPLLCGQIHRAVNELPQHNNHRDHGG